MTDYLPLLHSVAGSAPQRALPLSPNFCQVEIAPPNTYQIQPREMPARPTHRQIPPSLPPPCRSHPTASHNPPQKSTQPAAQPASSASRRTYRPPRALHAWQGSCASSRARAASRASGALSAVGALEEAERGAGGRRRCCLRITARSMFMCLILRGRICLG